MSVDWVEYFIKTMLPVLAVVKRTSGTAVTCFGATRLTQCGHSPDRIPQCSDLRAVGCSMGRGPLQNLLLRPTKALPNSEARRKAQSDN